MEKPKFEWLPHTADIKFKVYGKTEQELFENSALAISEAFSKEKKVSPKRAKFIEVSGEDYESLLYRFLDELIYLVEVDKFVVSKASVQLRGFNLKAEIFGDDAKNYTLDTIKATTYSEMYFKKNKDLWEAQVVLDV